MRNLLEQEPYWGRKWVNRKNDSAKCLVVPCIHQHWLCDSIVSNTENVSFIYACKHEWRYVISPVENCIVAVVRGPGLSIWNYNSLHVVVTVSNYIACTYQGASNLSWINCFRWWISYSFRCVICCLLSLEQGKYMYILNVSQFDLWWPLTFIR